ncbi:MAG: sensor histidine kinase [Lachnospiraceae bacterium]|jgi:signal transduction histidine kinase|nr:sensor histidine kinase [Lachnospiraceae bacterium]
MSISTYLKDKLSVILLNSIGVFFLTIYLLATGSSNTTVGLIILIWSLTGFSALTIHYLTRKKYFQKITDLLDSLDQPYLVQELMDPPWRLEDRLYHEILYRSNKAVMEQIRSIKEEQLEYREFLEGWIHEAKLPITGMRLACHNQSDPQRIELYLTEMDHLVEQALFYAKSEQVYKDFQIRTTDLKEVVRQVVRQNKYLLMQNGIHVEIRFDDCTISTDPRWLSFMITQLLINAVKYKKVNTNQSKTVDIDQPKKVNVDRPAKTVTSSVCFDTEVTPEGTALTVMDNGIGIPADELERVFDKGFTGSNGRERERSTGIGLYLCHKLCHKLGITIKVNSVVGEYTQFRLFFPCNSWYHNLSEL